MGGKSTRIFIGILGWACCLHEILSAPNPGSFMSAQPPSAMKVLNLIVCEGQKAYLSCRSIFDQIKIVETMYGRKSPSICVPPIASSNAMCQEEATQINHQIKDLCEGETDCEIAANNNFLAKAGTTICPDVYKYLDVKYRCIPRSADFSEDSASETSENSQSVSEVIASNGGESLGSSSFYTSSSSSSSKSASVPEITVQEYTQTQPVTTATSQASVTPISHKANGDEVTEEFTRTDSAHDTVTETFPSGQASSKSTEVNETVKKSETPKGSGEEQSEDASGSGEWEGINQQRDIVYDMGENYP
ncbi:uncharacterized protein [Montipora capricornis]|uniref:uncharacterized protein isoform X1 n=2 Tax=Montipora capricornis TaxID=246305 RepID=UPI0035F1A855